MITRVLDHELPPSPGTLLTDDFNPINVYRVATGRQWRPRMISYLGADFMSDF